MSQSESSTESESALGWDDVTEGGRGHDQARVLSQTEIDDLLGFDDPSTTEEPLSGLRRIVNAGLVSYERLPMLEVVFDRLVRLLSTSLRNLTNVNVEINIDEITSLMFGSYIDRIPLPTLLMVFKAEQWDNYGLMVIDAPMIYSIVDVLLGGRKGTTQPRIEGRPYTAMERALVERVTDRILSDMSESFDAVCQITFRPERVEVNPQFAAISRASNAAIIVKLKLEMDERYGSIDIVLPYATLEPIRDLLLQRFMGERFGRDSIWEAHLAQELRDTDCELEVILGERPISLSEVLALEVGSQLIFPLASDDPVQVRCGGVSLFLAKVGNRRNHVSVQIEKKFARAGMRLQGDG